MFRYQRKTHSKTTTAEGSSEHKGGSQTTKRKPKKRSTLPTPPPGRDPKVEAPERWDPSGWMELMGSKWDPSGWFFLMFQPGEIPCSMYLVCFPPKYGENPQIIPFVHRVWNHETFTIHFGVPVFLETSISTYYTKYTPQKITADSSPVNASCLNPCVPWSINSLYWGW